MRAAVLLAAFTLSAHAQWTLQQSNTTTDLRGIDNVGHGIAWASGSNGTVLHTTDNGATWLLCKTPPDAEHLDFRGIQAFDANTAIVMSSGKGDLSRLYKTTDGCQTWKLTFTNPDPDGFWDALQAHIAGSFDKQKCQSVNSAISGAIFGDPTVHRSNQWDTTTHPSFYLATFAINSSCAPDELTPSATVLFSGPGEAAFAASNSVLRQLGPSAFWMGTSRQIIQWEFGVTSPSNYAGGVVCGLHVPFLRSTPSQGLFSFAIRPDSIEKPKAIKFGHNFSCIKADIVAVGGDYSMPDNPESTAAFSAGTNRFSLAQTPPHGYRSAVAYDAPTKTWVTVGPNGTDISTDDGRNWRALKPSATDTPDADQHWNALSLPFVVGPHGRIGLLNSTALQPAKH